MARLFRAWWLGCAAVPVALLQLTSCSDDPESGSSSAVEESVSAQHVSPHADAGAAPTLPKCIGTSVPLIPAGERAYASVNLGLPDAGHAGEVRGDFILDYGSNVSSIDLKAFTHRRPMVGSCLGDAGAPGATCNFPNFDFFGSWGTVSLFTADYSSFAVDGTTQAGIIGTDFLSVDPFTLEYTKARISQGAPGAFCTDAQLASAGMVAISASGFFTNKPSTLRPLSEVITGPDASATAGYTVPNVPTLPVTIAGVHTLAQLDTGYDDHFTRHSININAALLDQLMTKSPKALTRRPEKDLFLSTCVRGLSQQARAYVLAPATKVTFVAHGGAAGRTDTGAILFVKDRVPGAVRCGGIDTWTVPAAQMGASFLVDAQAVVFDPITSRVWLPKN